MTRNTTPTHTEGRASPMPVPEVKKPPMPRKELKTKMKVDTPILAKNESSGSSTGGNARLREAAGGPTKATPSPLPPSIRRLPPGSGFKAKASSPSLPSPPTATIPQKRPHPTETAERREPSRLASSSRPSPSAAQLPPKPSPAPSTTKQMAEPQKGRGDEPLLKRKRLEDDSRTEILHTVRIPKKRKPEGESQVSSKESRDQSTYEDGELPESPVVRKRPKLDDDPRSTPHDGYRERERERERPREHRDRERESKTLPPKPVRARELSPPPRKSQQSSTPSTQQSRDSPSDKPTTTVRATSKPHNGRFARGSSIYTSSDDEMPLKKQTQAPQPKNSANVPPQHRKKRDPPPRPPLPSDPAGIRAAYRERYVPYITTYGKVVAQRAKLEEALSGSVSSDMDLMDQDEVTKLANEHKMYQRELEAIEAAYSKAGGRGKLEPQRVGRSSSSD